MVFIKNILDYFKYLSASANPREALLGALDQDISQEDTDEGVDCDSSATDKTVKESAEHYKCGEPRL